MPLKELPAHELGHQVEMAMKQLTYDMAQVAAIIDAPSERWVVDQVRAGRFPARKLGRSWRMTEQDIADSLEACRNTRNHDQPAATQTARGLTPTSRKRLARS